MLLSPSCILPRRRGEENVRSRQRIRREPLRHLEVASLGEQARPGGVGHLLMRGQACFLTYEETISSMQLFTKDVYPRLQELTASYDSERLQELRAHQPHQECAELGAFGLEFVR